MDTLLQAPCTRSPFPVKNTFIHFAGDGAKGGGRQLRRLRCAVRVRRFSARSRLRLYRLLPRRRDAAASSAATSTAVAASTALDVADEDEQPARHARAVLLQQPARAALAHRERRHDAVGGARHRHDHLH